MRSAVLAARKLGPGRLVVAVPVAARSTCQEQSALADEVVCAATPDPLEAVGAWYDDFSHTRDEEVLELLVRSLAPAGT